MTPFTRVEGRAYPLPLRNVDTDLIIPAAHLKTIQRQGLGRHAFEPLRAEPGNVFDEPQFAGAPILVALDNFGCGSSREHAAWALADMGVRAVIAPSFSDIFAGNAFKNGIVTVALDEAAVETLLDDATRLADKAKEAGVEATLQIWDEMPHVWHLAAPSLPEGQEAIDKIGEFVRELPAGAIEPGVSPLDCAIRELAEETGYQARTWQKLAEFYPSPGVLSERTHLFVARDLTPGVLRLESDEQLEPRVVAQQVQREHPFGTAAHPR